MKVNLPSVKYYPEIRRLLKDRLVRTVIIVLVALLLIYSFDPSNYIQSLAANTPRLSEQFGTGDTAGASAATQDGGNAFDPLKPQSMVGKVHAVFGEPNPVYERALELHRSHAEKQGHPMFLLRERVLSGLWSKPAFILSAMLQELAKPEEERLQWLL